MLVKFAATKWKTMVDKIDPKDLEQLLPDKVRYIEGMKKGIDNRIESLQRKHGINIAIDKRNSRTVNMFGMDLKPPLPHATIPLDSKNFYIVAPRSHTSSLPGLLTRTNGKNDAIGKMLHHAAMQHELTEVSRMAKAYAHDVPVQSDLVDRVMRDKSMRHVGEEAALFNPLHIGPKYRSHFDKKVLNTDINMVNKNPFKKFRDSLRTLRESEI